VPPLAPTPGLTAASGLATTDLVEFNRWLSITRLRAAGALCLFTLLAEWLGIGNIDSASVVAVCGALALVSLLGLATDLPRRRPNGFFYGQCAADIAGIALGLILGTQAPETALFGFIFVLVVVPIGLVSVPGGIAAAAVSSACHLLILGSQHGFRVEALLSIEGILFPMLFFLVAQQCFFYGAHTARKNVALAGLATRLEENQQAIAEQANMSQALFDVARTLASTMEGSELLSRLNSTVRSHLDAPWAATFLSDGERGVFRLAATTDGDTPLEDLVRMELPVEGWPAVGRLQREAVLVLTDLEAQHVPTMFTGGRRYDTVLLAGFQHDERAVGFLAVGFDHLDETASARGKEFLLGIAQHASIVLRNARLLEDVRHASNMKSEFVGAVSHELRSPLNVTLGYLEMLEDEALGPVNASQRAALQKVRQESLALLEMITALLDLNRLEAGRFPVVREEVHLAQIFTEVCERLPTDWRHPDVSVHTDVAVNVPPIQTDPGKLKTIVRNLLHNALKFTQRGWVSLSAGLSPAGDVVISVRDTGCGIPADALEYIFDMFRQVPGAGGGGVGLGLHLVQRLTDVLGASVHVESAPGLGTAFRITLQREDVTSVSEPDGKAA